MLAKNAITYTLIVNYNNYLYRTYVTVIKYQVFKTKQNKCKHANKITYNTQ